MRKLPSDKQLTTTALPEELPDWGVLVLESHHAADFTMSWRTHRFVKVIYALSGSGCVLIESEKYPFRPRDVIVVPPKHKNRIVDDVGTDVSLYVLCLDTKLLRFDTSIVSGVPTGRLHTSGHFANQVQTRLRRLLFQQSRLTRFGSLSMVADALQLLGLVIKQPLASSQEESPNGDQNEVAGYVHHLKTHFFEATTIDAAADQLGMPRRRFTSLFRNVTGQSWLEHVRQLRMEHAKKLLRETDVPVTSVAFECGYEDLSTFYRQFKRQVGKSPGAWRECVQRQQGSRDV